MLQGPMWKLPFLLVDVFMTKRAFQSPTPPPSSEERQKYEERHGTLTRLDRITTGPLATLFVMTVQLAQLIELYAILTTFIPLPPFASRLEKTFIPSLSVSQSCASQIHLSLPFIIGSVFIIAGSVLRLSAFRTLGRHFTFNLSLQEGHKLVVNGPYSFVRHPSYSGGYLIIGGMLFGEFADGSWMAACGLHGMTTFGKVLCIAHLLAVVWMSWLGISRTWKEDNVLKEVFKDQWVSWSKQTPYRLIPWVY